MILTPGLAIILDSPKYYPLLLLKVTATSDCGTSVCRRDKPAISNPNNKIQKCLRAKQRRTL